MPSKFANVEADIVTQSQDASDPKHLVPLAQVHRILNAKFRGAWAVDQDYLEGQLVKDDGALWLANVDNTGKKPADNPTEWRSAVDKGDSAYVYIAYADAADGTGFSTSDATKDFVAIKTTTSPIGSPAAGDFTGLWKQWKGTDGTDGTDGAKGDKGDTGASAFVYIAYASDNSGTGFTTTFNANLNFIAVKTTTTAIPSPSASDFAGLWKQYGTPALAANAPITYNSSTGTFGINASSANTANYVVQRDSSGNFAANKIVLGTSNATDHLTLGGSATIGFNSDAVYFNQPISTSKVKLSTTHELRTATSNVQFYSNAASANVWETSGGLMIIASLRLSGLSGVLKADGSGNVTGSATTDNLTEGGNLYYTAARANSAADARIALQAGAANGLATLDSSGKIPTGQIPSALLGAANYQGGWNATTNSPALASSTGSKGFYYVVTTAGSTNLDGVTDWKLGDWAIFNGATWEKVDNTDAVISVNGQIGTVVLDTDDLSEGANKFYTDARVRACTLTGISTGTGGAIGGTDTVLTAFGKAENRLAALESRSTTDITEGTNLYYTDARVKAVAAAGLNAVVIAPAASTSGSPFLLTVTGPAHTTLAASSEATDVYLNLNRIVQFATGALTTQRAARISAPKYAFAGASTLTDASSLAIDGAPIAWSNATITNAAALRIYGGAVAAGNTNAYGLYVDAPTGATNNYAAVFATGNVGIGTAAPTTILDINGSMRLRSISTPGSPQDGEMWYDGTNVKIRVGGTTKTFTIS